MPDTNDTAHEPDNFGDLPIQPTGSGVADLEVAYEQMRLAEEDGGVTAATSADEITPTEDTEDAADSAAHPS
ncbi:hypothetical protein ASG67_15835 [Sphingomonas sp. Leaf339]|uniref:hypothetical protein n=1 Tax=Sphingomonas sp. Leaf339 TaxID=1736343 RepID=UPI0006FF0ACB|nr:hypothetical protein [Sphingomonas sp. Leaf339]KQU45145.1 hypothetical protein ASG67_15835 [Sphingomonas sp. Leaf339]